MKKNLVSDTLSCIPHFKEADRIDHDYYNWSSLMRNQEAGTNCNRDTSKIMKRTKTMIHTESLEDYLYAKRCNA